MLEKTVKTSLLSDSSMSIAIINHISAEKVLKIRFQSHNYRDEDRYAKHYSKGSVAYVILKT